MSRERAGVAHNELDSRRALGADGQRVVPGSDLAPVRNPSGRDDEKHDGEEEGGQDLSHLISLDRAAPALVTSWFDGLPSLALFPKFPMKPS